MPLITVVANCQARAVGAMCGEVLKNADIRSYEVHTDQLRQNLIDYERRIATSDIIFMQPIHDGFWNGDECCSSWIVQRAKSTARIVTFPSLYFSGDHPSQGYLSIDGTVLQLNDKNPYLYCFLAKLAVAGASYSAAIDFMASPQAFNDAFLANLVESSISAQRQREVDDQIDVRITPYLQEFAGSRQLFHTINHPMRPILAEVVNELLRLCDRTEKVTIEGVDYLDWLHIPVLPCVERYHQLKRQQEVPVNADKTLACVIEHSDKVSHDVYIERMVTRIFSQPHDKLISAIDSNWQLLSFCKSYDIFHDDSSSIFRQ